MEGVEFYKGDGVLVRFRDQTPPEGWDPRTSRWYYWTGNEHDLNQITDQQAEDIAGSRDALAAGFGQPVVEYSG